MINSKDYVKANTPYVFPENSVEELKGKLEKLVLEGKEFFDKNGYIPLDAEARELFFKVAHDEPYYFKQLSSWLEEYNWFIARISPDTLKQALFAIR